MRAGKVRGVRCYDLNRSNRPVRTRMPGGVAGDRPVIGRPYADPLQRLFTKIGFAKNARRDSGGFIVRLDSYLNLLFSPVLMLSA